MSFKEVSVSDLSFNPFTKIGKEWMLITSGDENKWNTMTASWGFVGVIWSFDDMGLGEQVILSDKENRIDRIYDQPAAKGARRL